jgi:FXSXX-COOH protein
VDRDATLVQEDGPQASLIADVRDVPLAQLATDTDGTAAVLVVRFLEGIGSPSRVQAMTFNSAI